MNVSQSNVTVVPTGTVENEVGIGVGAVGAVVGIGEGESAVHVIGLLLQLE